MQGAELAQVVATLLVPVISHVLNVARTPERTATTEENGLGTKARAVWHRLRNQLEPRLKARSDSAGAAKLASKRAIALAAEAEIREILSKDATLAEELRQLLGGARIRSDVEVRKVASTGTVRGVHLPPSGSVDIDATVRADEVAGDITGVDIEDSGTDRT